ncbi:MAG: GIY-YIG nuclease family protein [Mariprofundus sp.]|nr:GIY-YIG nuclease family protein [Mariprofundus sp.]
MHTNIDHAQPPTEAEAVWHLYLIRCPGGQLYTGISTDIARRFTQHQAGKGAKYLRGKAPLSLVFQQIIGTHSEALRAESIIKKLSKDKKETILQKGSIMAFIRPLF